MFLAPPRAGVEEVERLLAETLDLVAGELPGIDLSTPRRLLAAHRGPPSIRRTDQTCRHEDALLLRHAKSDWGDPGLPDQDRPLAQRGVRAGPRSSPTSRRGPGPSWCSARRLGAPGRRSRSCVRAFGDGPEIRIEDDLYGASAASILTRLRVVDGPVRSVLVIGHNPGLEDLTAALAGDADEAALEQLRTRFPTGALAVLEVSTGWAPLGPGAARLSRLNVPRR